MKKTFFYFNIIFSIQLSARENVIQTLFWEATFSGQPEFQIEPQQPGIAEDCQGYAKFLTEQSTPISAEDLEFARTLPLAGQMKNSYEVDFQFKKMRIEIKENKHLPQPPEFLLSEPLLNTELTTLKEIRPAAKTAGFAGISKKLGLKAAEIEIIRDKPVGDLIVRIKARDLVCDLLTKNTFLSAQVQLQISPNAEELDVIDRFYNEVGNKTSDILEEKENNNVKAALMGISFSEMLTEYERSPGDIKKNINYLFAALFKPGTLELNSNWQGSDYRKVLNYPKTRQLGFQPIALRM